MAGVALSDVTRSRRGVPTLRGVSLTVPEGAFCVVLGPAGAGKSTLIRLIAGRERPTSGEVAIGDAVLRSWGGAPDALAQVVDPSELQPRRTLYDNVARGLRRTAPSKAEAQARALLAAEAFGLGPSLARSAGRATFDERWRTVLARALAHRPAVLLFDEPLGGLPPAQRAGLRLEIRRLQRELGATVVYATHDAADALALADHLVVIEGGTIVQAGAPATVYAAPATVAAARIAGPFGVNVLPVRADQTGLSLEDGTTLGGASLRTNARFGLLGVRPEHLFALDGRWPPPGGARLPVRVEAVEPTGADTFVHGRVGPHAVTARLTGRVEASPGATLALGAAGGRLHMFDATTLAALATGADAPCPPETRTAAPTAEDTVSRLVHDVDPRGEAEERARHERLLAAARARLSR